MFSTGFEQVAEEKLPETKWRVSGYVNFRNKLPSFPKDSPRESFPFLLAHSLSQFLHSLPADLPSLIIIVP